MREPLSEAELKDFAVWALYLGQNGSPVVAAKVRTLLAEIDRLRVEVAGLRGERGG